MLERDDINEEIISGDAGGRGGAWVDGRGRGTLVDRPGSDLRRLEVFASCVPALRGNSGGMVSSFGAIVRILMDQSIECRPADSNRRTNERSSISSRDKKAKKINLRSRVGQLNYAARSDCVIVVLV